jgi:hypothetical protein
MYPHARWALAGHGFFVLQSSVYYFSFSALRGAAQNIGLVRGWDPRSMKTARKTVARLAASTQYARDRAICANFDEKIKVLDKAVKSG